MLRTPGDGTAAGLFERDRRRRSIAILSRTFSGAPMRTPERRSSTSSNPTAARAFSAAAFNAASCAAETTPSAVALTLV